MAALISAILFIFLMGAITIYGYRKYAKPGRVFDQLSAPSTAATAALIGAPAEQGAFVRITQQIGEKVPVSPQDISVARRYLVAAGHRSENAVRIYYGLRVVLCIGLLIAAFL